MTEQVDRSDLIARHEAVWDALAMAFAGVDAATAAHASHGVWSAKDHLAHVVAWEHHRLAVLRGEDVPNAMGVSAEAWATADEDALNALIADRTHDLPFEHAIDNLHATRSGLAAALRSVPDDRLTSRYRMLHPEDEERGDGPVGDWAIGLAEGHIGAHLGPIRARLAEAREERPPTVAGTLARIDAATDELLIAIAENADHDAVDADGWRVADHAFHVAAWDRGCTSLVSGSPRWEGLGVSERVWRSGETDRINAAIVAANRHRPALEATSAVEESRASLRQAVAMLDDDDLLAAYGAFQPDERPLVFAPVYDWISENGWAHPGAHAASMRRIGTVAG